jgi:DNA-3-methyladenine glycosylase I
MQSLPASTPESTELSKELRRRGFRFIGPTTAYAAMQSLGLVNDHIVGCSVRAACGREQREILRVTVGARRSRSTNRS